jgi:tetratricopeptide (TPR) repeat protein
MAEIVLETAFEIGRDPEAGLVDKVVAWQAAHRVRADLQDRIRLLAVQCELVRGLEDLGDPAAAYQVAHTALGDLYGDGHPDAENREETDLLSSAVLRLAGTHEAYGHDPLVNKTIAAVAAGGATVGLEARVWAAIELLGQPGQRDRALELTDQIIAELSHRNDLGKIGSRWRLQLAFHIGRAGHSAISQQLLAPMLNTPDSPENDAARAILRAVGGTKADTRLQVIGLEAELQVLPPDADDDHLRVHHALAVNYGNLGDYRQALHHSQQELSLRRRIQGVYHTDTLAARSDLAVFTGECGHSEEALQLFRELLPDVRLILGPDHRDTLATRGNIAAYTGECGNPAEALRLLKELLPDRIRVLGPAHLGTLVNRDNIAAWTMSCGDPNEALRLSRELLPDLVRVLGADHPHTLAARRNIAGYTGTCGHPEEALRLQQELLPDLVRVLGADHPHTLAARSYIAGWTGECGHPEEALRLFRELLPDQERVLDPDHPSALSTRGKIAWWASRCRRDEEALRILQELLPDKERVLGLDHPSSVDTQRGIEILTARVHLSIDESSNAFEDTPANPEHGIEPP